MSKVLNLLPELQGNEMMLIGNMLDEMSEKEASSFSSIYRTRRKDPQTILILCLIGFLGIGGIHRFVLGQIGMGILYILTAGLCYIGTIVDLFNYREMTDQYNMQIAEEVAYAVRAQV